MKYDLERFINAQKKNYSIALNEIKKGKKVSHWMWYIFPQLEELGSSNISKYYGIKNKEEALEFINNDYLKNNLIKISEYLYKLDNNVEDILGYPDYLKLKSCMTLFNYVAPDILIFQKVIDKFYDGEKDKETLNLIE